MINIVYKNSPILNFNAIYGMFIKRSIYIALCYSLMVLRDVDVVMDEYG
jgi:hypothetical protein